MICLQRPKIRPFFLTGFLLAALLPAGGCALDHPTQITTKKVEVIADTTNYRIATGMLDDDRLQDIAAHYADHGSGPLNVAVTYNPKMRQNSAMRATDNSVRIASFFRKMGVEEVTSEILPVHDTADSVTMISYGSYMAQAPEGCNTLEDVDDSAHENLRDYELGCSTQSYLARQVARPQDLLGREVTEERGARRIANEVEGYKWNGFGGRITSEATTD